MKTATYSFFREKLSSMLDFVNKNHEPLIITRKNGSNAVLISLDDFNSYEETSYLMRSPKNAERLRNSIRSLDEGKIKERELIE
ncbi:type II toxin-antitoxin system prevent-host-death family antitoxin [Francisella sp. 19X1-34]|uniref:type II toxin-antitoxin system Phd/YefM family antitoxin n=1 Tax=Francisella sp. 19X1-34 TaxID=3087177 RepID=UPI002E32401F|nr:type II toxin-antitoxin system prevent-host-death family antitoxin [Francisella sp. 19X1-34]MED7789634.1 type II toxin-antitoxin system prevent-host-death family antitoxin [Francisella sp. 19X1-34]